jgi:hypothetical protein
MEIALGDTSHNVVFVALTIFSVLLRKETIYPIAVSVHRVAVKFKPTRREGSI